MENVPAQVCMAVFTAKKIKDWDNVSNTPAEKLTMTEIINLGKKAVSCLGENPDRQSKEYTTFHQNNYGQYVSNFMFRGLEFLNIYLYSFVCIAGNILLTIYLFQDNDSV